MTRFHRGRRAVTVVVVAVLLWSVPQLALAAFGSRATPTLAVGSASMVAPSAVSGSYKCSRSGSVESIQVLVTGFTDSGPAGATYRYQLLDDSDLVRASASSSLRTVTLSADQPNDQDSTTWRLVITAQLRGWTSPVSTTPATCSKGGKGGGSL